MRTTPQPALTDCDDPTANSIAGLMLEEEDCVNSSKREVSTLFRLRKCVLALTEHNDPDRPVPPEQVLQKAIQWIAVTFQWVTGHSGWIDPLVTATWDDEIVFEWWNADRKLTVYCSQDEIEARMRTIGSQVTPSRVRILTLFDTLETEWSWLVHGEEWAG